MKITVLIPTYNRWGEARLTLESLINNIQPDIDIVLIEDGCTDETVASCSILFPRVKIIHGDGNLWWSRAINMGIEYAVSSKADAVILFNDDNRVNHDTVYQMIQSHLRAGPMSVICARNKSIVTGRDEWVGSPPLWHPDYNEWKSPSLTSDDIRLKHPPGGRGVLIPVECFKRLGAIDYKAFPHYWADHDFHYRAMNAGYKYYLAVKAVVWNVPNEKRPGDPDEFTARWIWNFLSSRRSPMNLLALRRLLKRHLSSGEFRSIFYPLAFKTATWLASGWVARKPMIHKSLRALRRTISI